jgi:N-acetylglutamate synthase-like GNAT family acetyltransferase
MIRKATLDDVSWIVKYAVYDMCNLLGNPELYNPRYLTDTFVPFVIQNGVAIVDEKRQGIIGGMVIPHLYNPEKKVLSEMMWWVDENVRGSSLGYRLLKAFEEEAKKAQVDYIQMSLMESSTIKSLEKQGYRRKEFALIKEI